MNSDKSHVGCSGGSGNPSKFDSNEAAGDAEDDSEDSTLSSHFSGDMGSELSQFRRQWQQELENSASTDATSPKPVNKIEEKARELYFQGAEAERKNHLCDAIYYYRRAIQLDPDIEFKVAGCLSQPKKKDDDEDSYFDEYLHMDRDEYMELAGDDEDEDFEMDDLLVRFTKLCNKSSKICQPLYEQSIFHISCLPSEILLYICKWVISSELDMKSLEQLSGVCRGFYICARDTELWKTACMRVWGVNCSLPNQYQSWRDMFIKHPRLQCNGVYISKATYVRPGEPAFQDLSYRPWHLVEYYRYLRFFPGGHLLMLTTPEEPSTCVGKLRNKNLKNPAILAGHYRIHGSLVSAVLKRPMTTETPMGNYRYRRHRQNQPLDNYDQTFHMEFEVMNYKNRSNCKLEWRHYSIRTVSRNGQDSVSELNLSNVMFPPLWFSRVKSYTATSERPLI
ncbi:hypothetical protein CHUAL_002454 [Chamberlinius hualienensis]